MPETTRSFTIARRRFRLERRGVERAMRDVLPAPIASHYVVIGGRRFPPKQVISTVTGLDRADFTTHQARRTLLRLGFHAGRCEPSALAPSSGSGAREASGGEALRPFIGRWVAVRDDEVLVAADDPREIVQWLSRHGRSADSMFRVPADEVELVGLAPE
jgi:hypothetical protein